MAFTNLDENTENVRSSGSGLGLIAAACILALGLVGGGYFIGYALKSGLDNFHRPHTITVKGLAERQVKADLALWPLRFVTAGNDLAAAEAKIESDQKAVIDFLKAQGLPEGDVTAQRTDVVDLLAREYRNENLRDTRYIVYGNVMIRSNNPDMVQKISLALSELVKAGVVFTTEGIGSPASLTPYYLFTKLNGVKPEMLSESTKNARDAARQLARDSGVLVGALTGASQGVFSILPGDSTPGATEESQITKTVRVVSTFEYAATEQ